jgi:mannose-6-phosphate isomerase-like protein (cupin superfamily)
MTRMLLGIGLALVAVAAPRLAVPATASSQATSTQQKPAPPPASGQAKPQTPATGQPAQAPAQPPAAPKPRTTVPAGRPLLVLQVTDSKGEGVGEVTVRASGPLERVAKTNADGSLRLPNLRPGVYRLRFEREGFVTFEREVTLPSGGRPTELDVTLAEAPTGASAVGAGRAAAPAAPPPPPEPSRPAGDPATVNVTALLDRSFIGGSEPVKEALIGCTGYATVRLLRVRETMEHPAHADADETFDVVGGEGKLRLGDEPEQSIGGNTIVVIPRGTPHAFTQRGRNPLIMVSVLSGPPCATAKP